MSRVREKARKYKAGLANVEKLREDLYEEIRDEHAKGEKSVRALAAETEDLITYGRVGQIVRGE